MSVDLPELLIDLGEARDQGPRPTCLSFSLSEIHRAEIELSELLSPESLHRKATGRFKKPISHALTIQEATSSLNADGQTTEAAWPYNAEEALYANCSYYRAGVASLPFTHEAIVETLRSGKPLGLVIDVDMTFFSYTGSASLALSDNSQVQGRHALVTCGVRACAGKFEYFIKNSWGNSWGMNGYAWLTFEHISGRSPFLVRI
jgi:hypothetical protein